MDQLVPRCPCRVRSNMLNASTSLNPKLVELFVTQVGPAARSGTPIEPHTTEAYAVEHEHSEPHLFAHFADLPVTPLLENKPQLVWLAPEIGTPLDDTRTRRRCERRRALAVALCHGRDGHPGGEPAHLAVARAQVGRHQVLFRLALMETEEAVDDRAVGGEQKKASGAGGGGRGGLGWG